MNRWGFIAGLFFTCGVFKEYLYFGVVPMLLEQFPTIPGSFYTQIYSVMTAMLYYLAMPSTVMVAFEFAEIPQRHLRFYRYARFLIFIPALLFGLAVPYTQTREYQLHLGIYYLSVSIYNWSYGIWITYLLISTLIRKRLSHDYHQRCWITISILLPLWYWLLTAFLIHSLKLYPYFKVWQGNVFVIFFLLIFFFYHLFHDGIWGARFYRDPMELSSTQNNVRDNTLFITHALKNELAKIQWAASAMAETADPMQAAQLQILQNSVQHLEHFVKRTRLLTQDISLNLIVFPVYPLLKRCLENFISPSGKAITLHLNCPEEALVFTDPDHLTEILQNLIHNAADAIEERGEITLSYQIHPAQKCSVLSVSDTGQGMDEVSQQRLFQPYFTTKGTPLQHLGLGLYYCYRVMEKQNGGLRVKSILGQGSTFFLYFPYSKRKIQKGIGAKTYE